MAAKDLQAAVSQLHRWTRINNKLERQLKFKDFNEAFAFMTR